MILFNLFYTILEKITTGILDFIMDDKFIRNIQINLSL